MYNHLSRLLQCLESVSFINHLSLTVGIVRRQHEGNEIGSLVCGGLGSLLVARVLVPLEVAHDLLVSPPFTKHVGIGQLLILLLREKEQRSSPERQVTHTPSDRGRLAAMGSTKSSCWATARGVQAVGEGWMPVGPGTVIRIGRWTLTIPHRVELIGNTHSLLAAM